MSLAIDDPDVDRLARELAEATGETTEEAITRSLQERLDRVQEAGRVERERRVKRILEHGRRFRALPVVDPRSVDQLLDYDEAGLPC